MDSRSYAEQSVCSLCRHLTCALCPTRRHKADRNIQRIFSHGNLTGKHIICDQNGRYSYSHILSNKEDRKVCTEVVTHGTSCSLLVLCYFTPQYLNIQYCGTCYIFCYTESWSFGNRKQKIRNMNE